MKTHLLTYCGHKIDPFKMGPDDVCLEDIAHALSLLCRYGGHTKELFSVAEHSILVALRVWLDTYSLEVTRYALLHDATEAYVQDLISPVKSRLKGYRILEKKVAKAIDTHFKFRVTSAGKKLVKKHDVEIRAKERTSPHYQLDAKTAERNFKRLYNFIEHAKVHGASRHLVSNVFLSNV